MRYLCFIMLCMLCACGGRSGYSSYTSPAPAQVRQQAMPEITMQHSYYASNDSLHLLLKFEDVRQVLDVLQASSSYEYAVRTGLSDRDAVVLEDSINLPDRRLTDVEGQLHIKLSLPGRVVQEPNVLHLQLWEVLSSQERMGVEFRVPLQRAMMQKGYLLTTSAGKPLYQNYVTTSDKLLVRSYSAADSIIPVSRYELDFMPAAPPMSMTKPPVPRTLAAVGVDTLTTSDTLSLAQEGLYLFNPESSFARGVLALPGKYPYVTQAAELIPPLIYLTTAQERESLMKAQDPKAAVDAFWLEVGGNESRARELIRTYYKRVEMANKLFTAHKAGWATDRGMIYIIYGRPSSISQVGPNITWIYRDSETSPYIKFVFTKKENKFTKNYYELVRRREYEESWYSSVAKWRAGKTNL
ncbi:GWxTD domain-containing protein [Pontibacter chinhatensis]|nr:GWxTD domain-containing protein [Pontibacter chinhatensis]